MDLYTLDANFQRTSLVETYQSLIWTERYTKAGDFVLVTEALMINRTFLAEGTLMELDGSDEIMIIETVDLKDGTLKVSGTTLLKYLVNLIFRNDASHLKKQWSVGDNPESLMNQLVAGVAILGGAWANSSYGIDGAKQVLPGLTIENTGPYAGGYYDIGIPFGPLYDALVTLAETYAIGQKIRLAVRTSSSFALKYKTYQGRNLASDQNTYPFVKFSPALDSLRGVSELRSIANYKNVAYAFAPNNTVGVTTPGIAYADAGAAASAGFNRRAMLVFVDDTSSDIVSIGTAAERLTALLNQRAKDALANNNYIKMIDGEIVPQVDYVYGVHYKMGDIIELDGGSGISQKARITEYIRTTDNTGERAYPTVSVL